MGYIRHDLAVIVTGDYDRTGLREALPQFREALPEEYRHLVVGPVPGAINSVETWFFAPDGSKEGWEHSNTGDTLRQQFLDLARTLRYEDGSGADWAHFSLGSDNDSETAVVAAWRYEEPEPEKQADEAERGRE